MNPELYTPFLLHPKYGEGPHGKGGTIINIPLYHYVWPKNAFPWALGHKNKRGEFVIRAIVQSRREARAQKRKQESMRQLICVVMPGDYF